MKKNNHHTNKNSDDKNFNQRKTETVEEPKEKWQIHPPKPCCVVTKQAVVYKKHEHTLNTVGRFVLAGKAELDIVSWYMPKYQVLELGLDTVTGCQAEFLSLHGLSPVVVVVALSRSDRWRWLPQSQWWDSVALASNSGCAGRSAGSYMHELARQGLRLQACAGL